MAFLMSLPFKLSAQPKGTQKAYSEMTSFYGQREGERIFLKKADEQGTGTTIRQKCNSIYRKGSHVVKGNSNTAARRAS